MRFDKPANDSYACTVIKIPTLLTLEGLDNLVGVPVFGHQALTQKDIEVGDLRLAFTAETQLSEDYCAINSLYRDKTLNKDPEETGYLEKNRRIRAIKLRGNRSNALLMPLDSVAFTGINVSLLKEGDTFDSLNGHELCRKYEPKPPPQSRGQRKVARAFRRVDVKVFPEHLDTDQYFRNKHLLKQGREVVITQKLHGSSFRAGRVPVLRKLSWFERLLIKIGIAELV